MGDNLQQIVVGVLVATTGLGLGWGARTYVWGRTRARKQRFFGLPDNSECVLVVSGAGDWPVARHDTLALLELSSLVKECGAHVDLISHDADRQGFGGRTEFCVGGPVANRRMAAHLQSLLPGVAVGTDAENGPDLGAFTIGTERHRLVPGTAEHVLLARLTAGQNGSTRPVFLLCGQRSVTVQAAARHLTRNHVRLARKYGTGPFCLLLKVVNSQAYGSDVVEVVADVTRAATTPPQEPAPARKGTHRAAG